MTKFFLSPFNFILFLGILIGSVLGSVEGHAAEWRDFWVNESHGFYNDGKAFKARISFTVERMVPTIGMEQGANFAGKLFVELYTMDHLGHCPNVSLSEKSNGGSSLVYSVPLKYNALEAKCWGEVSYADNPGRFLPQGIVTRYFSNPILLTIGNVKQQNTLFVQDSSSYREFNFILADSIN